MSNRMPSWFLMVLLFMLTMCGSGEKDPTNNEATRTIGSRSILLITLDTTRADAVDGGSRSAATPHLHELAMNGRVFEWAFSTAPTTLPAHTTMMTGLLPGDHGIRENGRVLPQDLPLLAPRLKAASMHTAAFVSAYPLAASTGISRGFDHYDDRFPVGKSERRGDLTANLAIQYLTDFSGRDLFLWVHLFDPHFPYEPPAPFEGDGYLGEVAFTDAHAGRVLEAFQARFPEGHIVVAGDHGEGLGDHGEAQHGNLAYNATLHVPLLIAGPSIEPSRETTPVSITAIFDTVLTMAGIESESRGLLGEPPKLVLAEAMKPYLQYGWAPQVAAIHGQWKYILAGEWEAYDLALDPGEARDVFGENPAPRIIVEAVQAYALPEDEKAPLTGDAADAERLASLGYSAPSSGPPPRDQRPAPRSMTALFADLDLVSGLFGSGRYAEAVPVFERLKAKDPSNLSVILRLAVAYSLLDRSREAEINFDQAVRLDPNNGDARHYLGKHLQRVGRWDAAGIQFEEALRITPERPRSLAALGTVRERQNRHIEALELYAQAAPLLNDGALYAAMGRLYMRERKTQEAIGAFEMASKLQGQGFTNHLELGALYLDAGRPLDAAGAFERVPTNHPGYALALYKRAQTAALMRAPDVRRWIDAALGTGNADVARMIENDQYLRPFR